MLLVRVCGGWWWAGPAIILALGAAPLMPWLGMGVADGGRGKQGNLTRRDHKVSYPPFNAGVYGGGGERKRAGQKKRTRQDQKVSNPPFKAEAAKCLQGLPRIFAFIFSWRPPQSRHTQASNGPSPTLRASVSVAWLSSASPITTLVTEP